MTSLINWPKLGDLFSFSANRNLRVKRGSHKKNLGKACNEIFLKRVIWAGKSAMKMRVSIFGIKHLI